MQLGLWAGLIAGRMAAIVVLAGALRVFLLPDATPSHGMAPAAEQTAQATTASEKDLAQATPLGTTADSSALDTATQAPGIAGSTGDPASRELWSGLTPSNTPASPDAAKLEGPSNNPAPASKPATPTTIPAPSAGSPAETAPGPPVPIQTADQNGDLVRELAALYDDNTLFKGTEYAALRGLFSRDFERRHQDAILRAWGDDQSLADWLAAHSDIQEELFTAIDPEHDNVDQALTIFKMLKDEFPNQVASYANLAIAVAVTWDEPRRGVYNYAHHQQRTKSTLPPGALDAMDSFRYFLQTERVMQGRGQFLPWEFLTHVVNHTTPLLERQWALQNYLNQRVMVGKCYKDVPYDTLMLETESQQAQLNGKEYTLANLRTFGGVCAMQADFASRVSKSVGVPAEYVRGESRSGESHAWVMWVELKSATAKSILFSLESHGRYRGDRYYVGTLTDPQTGGTITDRQLELRLHLAGANAQANRHATLVMKAYNALRETRFKEFADRLQFFSQAISLCPGHEGPWRALAETSRGEQIDKQHVKTMMTMLDKLFRTYGNFPDFTWEVFDDLVAFQEDPSQRIGLYQRLVQLYEAAARPDLSCEARLKLADYLVEADRTQDAIVGLAFTIKKFADEGRYVPRMLDRLETACQDTDGAQQHLLKFYAEFLPLIPPMRGDRPSPYCISMYERGIQLFNAAGQPQLAQVFALQLGRIKAGQRRKR